jgi:hypothetical protein
MNGLRLTKLTAATAIFDLQDRYAKDRGVRGQHPRPLGGVKYWIVARIANNVRTDYANPIRLITVRNPSGYDLFFDQVKLETSATSRLDFAEGSYVLKVDPQFYQRREFQIPLPQSDVAHSFDLEPSYLYPFPVASLRNNSSPTLLRGTLHATNATGIAGVTIEVIGASNRYITDGSGQWVLVFDSAQVSEDVVVTFTYPDNSIEQVAAVPVVEGDERSLVQAGLRGWAITESGRAAQGVSVSVGGYPGEVITEHDGSWFYFFGLNQGQDVVSVTARLPDGTALVQPNIQVQPRSMVVVPTFRFS